MAHLIVDIHQAPSMRNIIHPFLGRIKVFEVTMFHLIMVDTKLMTTSNSSIPVDGRNVHLTSKAQFL
jgi:hypothetical protein